MAPPDQRAAMIAGATSIPATIPAKLSEREDAMPKFIIEREMPHVGKLTDADLQGAAQKSCDVLRGLGPEVQWIESYVTADKIFCVYHAPSEKLIREHAERSGFPANKITKVERVIDPTTAERGGAAQAAA